MAEIDWKETRRYLGLHRPGGTVDHRLEESLHACGRELTAVAVPRAVWKRAELVREGKNVLSAGGIRLESRSLFRHLRDCRGVYLFAATLGAETDRLIRRAGLADMSRAVMLQACAASLLEAWCDEKCDELARQVEEEGLYLKPRFSPGYGDLSIACQQQLLEELEAPKRIGLTATAEQMLTPTKSVTALIGLTPDPQPCRTGCSTCKKTDCAFRKTE